jgi:hypothetical protein
MLSVIVHCKDPEAGPWSGPGFFNLATKHLEYDLLDKTAKEAFWIQKRQEMLERWRGGGRRNRRQRGLE